MDSAVLWHRDVGVEFFTARVQVIPSVLKECCGIEAESPNFCPGQLHS